MIELGDFAQLFLYYIYAICRTLGWVAVIWFVVSQIKWHLR